MEQVIAKLLRLKAWHKLYKAYRGQKWLAAVLNWREKMCLRYRGVN